ncbi:VOC family protein [Polaromonas sp. A23]|uniref:VOC family protein n=1 Tax=Polaromonas sp. A23 TaxID=1944133 RepID=UPI0009842095|nr:VOC family protein [Polaromonas sp. A23]OOG42903.1 VOC family virulence protein [Polaromonas sp. A23]
MASAPTHSFTIQHIDHIVLRVASLESARAFYCDVLGCKVARRRDELGLVHLSAGTSMIDLIALDGKLGLRGGAGPAKEGRNVDHLCLRVEPFNEAALTAHLAAHNIPTHGPAVVNFGAEGEGLSLYISDPDGNTVELKGPAHTGAHLAR